MVCMTRCVPEVVNGPTTINVQEQDIPVLESRGWVVSKSATEKKEPAPVKEEIAEAEVKEEKPAKSEKKSKF